MARRKPLFPPGSPWLPAVEYMLLGFGSLVMAASFNMFLQPNQIASGGVAGLSILVQHWFGIQPALTQWALNIPIFLLSLWVFGGKFGVRAAVGSLVFPLFVLLTSRLPPLTTNTLLASLYGGIGTGLGLGIVFRGRGSTGGLGLAAQIVHKLTGISLGICVAIFDGLVIVGAGITFTPEKALFALIGLFVMSKTIDIVQVGFRYSKVAFIISGETEAIRRAILYELDRGLTQLSGWGGYTQDERTVLMVVVAQNEVLKLKALVRAADPDAFVIISDTAEVLGEGFRRHG
ncbi:membrane protein [Gordoniibacillus kamchatkensis]|uniref:Membrane protein n=1 Tax=Gordoniibacillus kamchatkensis TaxID=1590651 RepID=A0ABR5AHZ7_9BACL|nr:YitT family protein [Paenibacillus sp. VKM B-2647]KIL40664.1 membrane protein [Paenibacillus sp. VKM B-2647]